MLVPAEDTVICIDNSISLMYDLELYDDLVRAVVLYADTKLKASRCNSVGVMALSSRFYRLIQHPSRHVPTYAELKCLRRSGLMDLEFGLEAACNSLQKGNAKATKRILLFVVTPLHRPSNLPFFKTQGSMLKERGVAIDVVSYNEKPSVDIHRNAFLQAFVGAANHNGNSHILHVPLKSSICDSLRGDPIIFPRMPWMETARQLQDDIRAIMKKQEKVVIVEPSRKGKNQAHGMEDDELAIMEKQDKDVNVEPSCKGKSQTHGMEDKLAIVEKQEKDVNVEPSCEGKNQHVGMVELELELSHMDNGSPKGKKIKKRKGKKGSSKTRNNGRR